MTLPNLKFRGEEKMLSLITNNGGIKQKRIANQGYQNKTLPTFFVGYKMLGITICSLLSMNNAKERLGLMPYKEYWAHAMCI